MAKTTVAVTEQTPAPTQTQTEEKTYLTANHKKEDKAVKNMTVKQKLSYLKAKQLQGTLNNDEKAEQEALEDELKSMDVKRDNNLKKEKNKEIEEPKDIFEEQDILEYMYKKWLLAGANWLFKKTYKGIVWLTDKAAEKIVYPTARKGWKWLKDKVSSKPAPQDSTTNFVKDIDKNFVNTSKANLAAADKSQDKFLNKLDRYSRGEATDAEKQTLSFQTINEMSPRQRVKTCNKLSAAYVNASNNVKVINYMASALTRAQMVQNTLGSDKPAPFDPTLFEAQSKRNALLIAQQLDGSRDPGKTMDTLYKDIEKANQSVNKSLDKGKYKEASGKHKSKDPRVNEALQRLHTRLGLDEQGKNIQTPQPQNTTGLNLYQQLVQYQDMDKLLSANEEQIKQNMYANRSDAIANQARKAAFIQRLRGMDVQNVPEHLRKKASNNNNNTNSNSLIHGNGGDGR